MEKITNYHWLFFLSLAIMLIPSCSNNDEFGIDEKLNNLSKDSQEYINSDAFFSDSLYQSLARSYPALYSCDTIDNSHLWVDEQNSSLRSSSSGTIKIYGYDEIRDVKTFKSYFSQGIAWDSRMNEYKNTVVLCDIKLYVKQVRIPKGTTLVLPPPSLMSSMKSMGRQPIGYSLTKPMITGYTYKQYSSTSTEDVYELITETESIAYNIEGRRIFNPPVYLPESAKNGPSSFEFKYQYINTDWD